VPRRLMVSTIVLLMALSTLAFAFVEESVLSVTIGYVVSKDSQEDEIRPRVPVRDLYLMSSQSETILERAGLIASVVLFGIARRPVDEWRNLVSNRQVSEPLIFDIQRPCRPDPAARPSSFV